MTPWILQLMHALWLQDLTDPPLLQHQLLLQLFLADRTLGHVVTITRTVIIQLGVTTIPLAQHKLTGLDDLPKTGYFNYLH